MQFHINDKYFSYPPFLSTSWNHIAAIHHQGDALTIFMNNGQTILIPNLPAEVIELIFKAHTAYLDSEGLKSLTTNDKSQQLSQQGLLLSTDKINEMPLLKFGISPLDGMGNSLQHNPSLANAPDLPKEMIQKIASITKIVAGAEVQNFPKGEPHCNCFYCQIARGLQLYDETLENHPFKLLPAQEESITEEDLRFQQWNIQQNGNQLFTVSNKLDAFESYTVFLGEPIGCTCGKSGCEHIVAVLRS